MSSILATASSLLEAAANAPLVADVIVKSTLLVLIAAALTRLMARSPASARHLVWALTIAALLGLPAAVLWMPWRVEVRSLAAARDALPQLAAALSARPVTALGGGPDAGAGGEARATAESRARAYDAAAARPIAPSSAGTVQPVAVSPSSTGRRSWLDPLTDRVTTSAGLLLALWLAGACWALARLGVGVLTVRWTVRGAAPVSRMEWVSLLEDARRSMRTDVTPRVLLSERAVMPFSFGVARPTIVLPGAAARWTAERRRSVLMHELAHLRRADLLTNTAVQLACALYWFHPLVWVAARRVRIEAERACDDLVITAGLRPSDYAGDLLEIARDVRWSPAGSVALAMARRSDFEGRLLAILAPGPGIRTMTAARAALVVSMFAAPAIAIAAAVPARREAPHSASDAARLAGDPALAADAVEQPGTASVPESTDRGFSSRMAGLATRAGAAAFAKVLGSETRIPRPSVMLHPESATAAAQSRGGDTAVLALMSVLRDPESGVRIAAVRALGQLQDPRAIEALGQALRADRDAQVREAAAAALGEIDSPRAVPALMAALPEERVAAVRAKIVWALGEIDDSRAVDALVGVLRDSVDEVRKQAVWALGEIESVAAVPGLIPLLRDSDVEVRRQAAWALGEIESADALQALSAAIKDADAEVREQVVWALGEIESAEALPALTVALTDAEPAVRRKAVWAIGEIDNLRTAPEGLVAAVRDSDREVRQAAAHALGEIGDAAAAPALIALTRDADTEVKRAAVEALAEIGGAQAMEALVGLLKDEDAEVRRLAAEALGRRR